MGFYMSKKLTLDEILKALNNLSTSEVLYLLNEYAKTMHKDVSREIDENGLRVSQDSAHTWGCMDYKRIVTFNPTK